jgi:hypothetical protein
MTTVHFTSDISGGPDDGLAIKVEAVVVHDAGVFVEPGHPFNGHEAGDYVESVVARAADGRLVRIDDENYHRLASEALRVLRA